jgi:ankyrin repeat protein
MSAITCLCCLKPFSRTYPVSVLHEFCEKNNYIEVCASILSENSVNTILYPSYSTPLHIAALSGSKETVLVLLSHGALPDVCNKEGKTPFHQVNFM